MFGDLGIICRWRKLSRSDINARAGATNLVASIVGHTRSRCAEVNLALRAGMGFAREVLMAWCDENGEESVFGIARSARLVERIRGVLASSFPEFDFGFKGLTFVLGE